MEPQQLSEAAGIDISHAQVICETLNSVFQHYDISTPERQAAFIAQCGHESDGFKFMEENLNYRAESLIKTWPRHFNEENAAKYAHNPERIANRVYGGRMGNGPEESGDGYAYRGRGYLQLTGKSNYEAAANALQIDLVSNPEIVGTPEGAVATAGWFWDKHDLNKHADTGDIVGMTKIINGGTIGLENRQARYEHALNVLRG